MKKRLNVWIYLLPRRNVYLSNLKEGKLVAAQVEVEENIKCIIQNKTS